MDDKIKLEWLENLPTHPDLTNGAVRTGARLAKYADKHGRDAYPGPARLARETGQSLRTVKSHLAELTTAGVVDKAKLGGSLDGKREATEYQLIVWWTRATDDTGVCADSARAQQTRATDDTGVCADSARAQQTRATDDTGTRATDDTGPVSLAAHHPCSTPAETPASSPLPSPKGEAVTSGDRATWQPPANMVAAQRGMHRLTQQQVDEWTADYLADTDQPDPTGWHDYMKRRRRREAAA